MPTTFDVEQIEERLREPARAVLAAIDEAETVALLQELVRAESVNPPGDVRAGVHACDSKLRGVGFKTRTVAIAAEKPNLIAQLGEGRPSLCFNAHLDTVPVGDREAWTRDPFGGEVVEGRVYGRGAGDDKASVTSQVIAGVAIARAAIPLNGALIVTAVADEEVGGRAGAVQLFEQGGLAPDWTIVGEQTRGRICVGEKGGAACRVHLRGAGAHASMPWLGVNAIEAMAEVIAALKRDLFPRLSERTHPLFLPSTGAVTTIKGGVKENIIPDACSIYIDRRLVPGETPDGCKAEIEALVRQVVGALPGIAATVAFDDPTEVWAASATEMSSPVVRAMRQANAALGLSTELTGFSAMTDGRYFTARRIPTIIYGPGDVTTAHTADEWVGVKEVVSAARAYALAALTLLG